MTKQIVVLGAGYAGLKTVQTLQKQKGDFHITLVDRNDYHYEATELHEVASGTQPVSKITYPIKDVLNLKKTTFIKDSVKNINPDLKEVILESGKKLHYDYCVIALGFRSETFGILGAKENALEMVDINSALNIEKHILNAMQKYKETQDRNYLKILVCGAGFTGIELVGALADGRDEYARVAGVHPNEIKIMCVEAATNILPMFDDNLKKYCKNILHKLGIELLLGHMIKEIKKGVVLYESNGKQDELEAKTIIWTTGVSGSEVISNSGFNEHRGRVVVEPDLTVKDHNDLYIIGDVAAFMDKKTNRPYPTTAQIATKMGKHAAENLYLQISNQPTKDFSYKSQGTVASIGNSKALGVVGNAKITGYPASFIKKMIMNKSLLDIGGVKELLAKGRFDLYH